jgi:hypothetical protein
MIALATLGGDGHQNHRYRFVRNARAGDPVKSTVEELRRGARVHSLMFASYVAKNSDRPYDVAWEGLVYRRADKNGASGAVVFGRAGAVGVFYDPRLADKATKKTADVTAMLKGAPPAILQVAKREALPLMSLDTDVPRMTAAFWSNAQGEIASARSLSKCLEDGAHLTSAELDKVEKCVAKLAERYGFDEERARAVLDLFGTKAALAQPANAKVVLPNRSREILGLVPNTVIRELLAGASIDLE